MRTKRPASHTPATESVRLGAARLHADDVLAFRRFVYGVYARKGRHDLPWRHTRDPYEILVSEFMLQQTQVSRVLDKYAVFIRAFPDVQTLADAPFDDVLRLWRGLGYNRRARNLHRLARDVVGSGGRIPGDYDRLLDLPGVGPATAGAVMAYAFDRPYAFLETNIRAVFLHHFFADEEDVTDTRLLAVAERTLDTEDPRSWHYALMDYGALLKRIVPNPSRRSRTHAAQAPFEGSTRQRRGRILALLLDEGALTTRRLAERLGTTPEQAGNTAQTLATEGFLHVSAGVWRLAGQSGARAEADREARSTGTNAVGEA